MATDDTGAKPKRPGGAERKRRNNEARKLELLAELRKLGWRPNDGTPIDAAPESDDGATEFTTIGKPDLDDPQTLLAWSRKYQATASYLAGTRPLTDALMLRLRTVNQFVTDIGVTQNRADVEERLVAVESLVENVKPHGAVQVTETHGNARATTARGGVAARRLRPVSGHALGPQSIHRDGRPPQGPDGPGDSDGGGEVR